MAPLIARFVSRCHSNPIGAGLGLIASIACVLASPSAHAALQLSFGVYASDKPTAMVEEMRPTLNLLEKSLTAALEEPVTIRMQVYRDYETARAKFVAGEVDFVRLGAASYINAKRMAPDIEILAAEKFNRSHFFEGVICVNSKSDIRKPADLVDKTFAFGSQESTIGRYLAQLYLAQHGITRSKLKSFAYLGRHDRVGTAVGLGQFDAGALEGTIFQKLVDAGVPIRALASFPNVTKAWVARAGLPKHIKTALATALDSITDPAALAALRFDGFEPASDSDYDLIRASIDKNGLFFDEPRS